jgi:hypothetical protein
MNQAVKIEISRINLIQKTELEQKSREWNMELEKQKALYAKQNEVLLES